MKKYNEIRIIDNDGKLEFNGSFNNLLRKFNNSKDDCIEYLDNCKEKGYECTTRTRYYDFEYNSEGLSDNWFQDIINKIGYENSYEMIEEIIRLSFKDIKSVRCDSIGNYYLIVLPKKYDSLIIRKPNILDHKFFSKLFREIKLNITERHNKTKSPKILVAEFVNDWKTKFKYADYNEGYRFYYNTKPEENKINMLLK